MAKQITFNGVLNNPKLILAYIYKSYLYTLPYQSTMFRTIVNSNRRDMLDNPKSVEDQIDNIKRSLTEILTRYRYTNIVIDTNFNEDEYKLYLDVTAIDSDGNEVNLSDSINMLSE